MNEIKIKTVIWLWPKYNGGALLVNNLVNQALEKWLTTAHAQKMCSDEIVLKIHSIKTGN